MFEAVKEGYVAEGRALKLLEAQLATGGVYDINKGVRVPVSTALTRNLCDSRFVNKFKDLSRTGEGKYTDPNTNETNLTYLDLIKRTVTDRTNNAVLLVINRQQNPKKERKSANRRRQRRRKIVVVDTNTGEEISIKTAFARGIIDEKTFNDLQQQQGKKVESEGEGADILNHIEELKIRLGLKSKHPIPCISGILDVGLGSAATTKGLNMADAVTRELIDATTALRIFEAQICTGGIYDIESNQLLSLDEAYEKGLIDQQQQKRLREAEKGYKGFKDSATGKQLSIGEAMKKGKVNYDTATRVMEYQVSTGK